MAAITLVSACLISNTYAANCSLIPEDSATLEDVERAELLNGFKFKELEKELSKQHRKNLKSEGGDLLTLRDLVALQQMGAREEKLTKMWADQSPTSFFAQLNAGMFYSDKAFAARGSRATANVKNSQWVDANKMSVVAQGYLRKAIQLDPRSALPHSTFIGLAAMLNQIEGKTPEQWLRTAEQVDPKGMAASISAINYLSPRWGGSYEFLDSFTAQKGKSVSKASTHYLQYNLVLNKASHYEVIERDAAKAQALFKQAHAMCDNSETAREGILRTY
ncbi:DUF4034 domain-containing protein [Comamonas sp. MYb21]|uniref:DUF4034 domain-containing protein n=1 Tax=Comamonas sp. MYb21 TaxID=1848648 RepID=UPI0030B1A886